VVFPKEEKGKQLGNSISDGWYSVWTATLSYANI